MFQITKAVKMFPSSPKPELAVKLAVKIEPSIIGFPRVAPTTNYNAPVHIDVGGTIYTSSLETLTS